MPHGPARLTRPDKQSGCPTNCSCYPRTLSPSKALSPSDRGRPLTRSWGYEQHSSGPWKKVREAVGLQIFGRPRAPRAALPWKAAASTTHCPRQQRRKSPPRWVGGLDVCPYRPTWAGGRVGAGTAMGYPHWLIAAGAILVVLGFIWLAHRRRNGAEAKLREWRMGNEQLRSQREAELAQKQRKAKRAEQTKDRRST